MVLREHLKIRKKLQIYSIFRRLLFKIILILPFNIRVPPPSFFTQAYFKAAHRVVQLH